MEKLKETWAAIAFCGAVGALGAAIGNVFWSFAFGAVAAGLLIASGDLAKGVTHDRNK